MEKRGLAGHTRGVPQWRAVIVLPGARALTITTHALFCAHVTASLKALKGGRPNAAAEEGWRKGGVPRPGDAWIPTCEKERVVDGTQHSNVLTPCLNLIILPPLHHLASSYITDTETARDHHQRHQHHEAHYHPLSRSCSWGLCPADEPPRPRRHASPQLREGMCDVHDETHCDSTTWRALREAIAVERAQIQYAHPVRGPIHVHMYTQNMFALRTHALTPKCLRRSLPPPAHSWRSALASGSRRVWEPSWVGLPDRSSPHFPFRATLK